MKKRSALLRMKDEGLKAVKLPFKLKREKKELEKWILDKEEAIAVLDDEIETLKCNETLDVDKILDKIDDLALTKRRLAQGEELMKELFDDDFTEPETEE